MGFGVSIESVFDRRGADTTTERVPRAGRGLTKNATTTPIRTRTTTDAEEISAIRPAPSILERRWELHSATASAFTTFTTFTAAFATFTAFAVRSIFRRGVVGRCSNKKDSRGVLIW